MPVNLSLRDLSTHCKRIVGPAAVMAAASIGAGAASSLILSGAWFGYQLLWVVLLTAPLLVITVDSAARIGLLNKDQGMFALICAHLHPGVAWLLLAINIPVHLLIGMGQMSVMTSAALSLFGYYPPATAAGVAADNYRNLELLVSLAFAAGIIWLLTSAGYQRMQRYMTAFLLLMLACFLVVALRGFTELSEILSGLTPAAPADLPVPDTGMVRNSGLVIMGILGSVLAPAAMLGMPYLSADNQPQGAPDLKQQFRNSVINLGFIYCVCSLCIVIAGGFALYPLANHAQIDSVHEASRILLRAFPAGLEFLGPLVFSAGMMIAALTTFVVTVELISYFMLDMFGYPWRHTRNNRYFKGTVAVCIILPALLAPLWTFPALFKLLLLMGLNALVVPLVYLIVLILINRKAIMGEHTASIARNLILLTALVLSLTISVIRMPEFVRALLG